MMLQGVAQVFKNMQGSPGLFERVTVSLGALAIFLFPVYWLIRDSLLLIAYVVAWGIFFFTIQRYECIRCINFECLMNRVPAEGRKEFENENFEKPFEGIDSLVKKPVFQERNLGYQVQKDILPLKLITNLRIFFTGIL
jgi:hypothetical protein